MKLKSEGEKKVDRYETTEMCSECLSHDLIYDSERGEIICGDCGLVVEDKLVDFGPEWRAFDSEQRDKRARTGAPMTYTIHDKGLSTMIDWKNKDFTGKQIPPTKYLDLQRLRKWQRRIRVSDASERNLAFALSELDRMASALGLSRDVRETASLLYRKSVEKNLIRGRSIDGVVGAVIYTACRQRGVPRTLNEISKASRATEKEIGRTYRYITKVLAINLEVASPKDYIPRFCSKLGLSGGVKAKATDLLSKVDEAELTSGRGPAGVAAAAIYIASVMLGEVRTQREVADIVGITEVTIRNRFKDVKDALGLSDFIFQ